MNLPPEVEVAAVQLPGRGGRLREPLLDTCHLLVPALTEALIAHMDRPTVFFGHSMGALLAFEVARRLRVLGMPMPQHLFVSGRRAPQIPNPDPTVHLLPDAALKAELQRYNGTPDVVLADNQLMALFLPILRADLALDETSTYTSEPPFDFPISACAGLGDIHVDHDCLAAWSQQSTARFAAHFFQGDHFYLKDGQEELLCWMVAELGALRP